MLVPANADKLTPTMGRYRRASVAGRNTRTRLFNQARAAGAAAVGAAGSAPSWIREQAARYLDPVAPGNQVAAALAAPAVAAGAAGYYAGGAGGPPPAPRRARPPPHQAANPHARAVRNLMPQFARNGRGRRGRRYNSGRYRRKSSSRRRVSTSRRRAPVGTTKWKKKTISKRKSFGKKRRLSSSFRAKVKQVINSGPQVTKYFKLTSTDSDITTPMQATLINDAYSTFKQYRPSEWVYPAGNTSEYIEGDDGGRQRAQTALRGQVIFPFNVVRRASDLATLRGDADTMDASVPTMPFRGNCYNPTYCAVRCGWVPGETRDNPGVISRFPGVSRCEHGFGFIKNMRTCRAVAHSIWGNNNASYIKQMIFVALGTKGKRDPTALLSNGWKFKGVDLRNDPDPVSHQLSYKQLAMIRKQFVFTKRVSTEVRPPTRPAATLDSVERLGVGVRGEGFMFGKTNYKFKLPKKHTINPEANAIDGDPVRTLPFLNSKTVFDTGETFQKSWIPFIFARGDSYEARTDGAGLGFDDAWTTNTTAGSGPAPNPPGTRFENQSACPAFFCDFKVAIRDEMEK